MPFSPEYDTPEDFQLQPPPMALSAGGPQGPEPPVSPQDDPMAGHLGAMLGQHAANPKLFEGKKLAAGLVAGPLLSFLASKLSGGSLPMNEALAHYGTGFANKAYETVKQENQRKFEEQSKIMDLAHNVVSKEIRNLSPEDAKKYPQLGLLAQKYHQYLADGKGFSPKESSDLMMQWTIAQGDIDKRTKASQAEDVMRETENKRQATQAAETKSYMETHPGSTEAAAKQYIGQAAEAKNAFVTREGHPVPYGAAMTGDWRHEQHQMALDKLHLSQQQFDFMKTNKNQLANFMAERIGISRNALEMAQFGRIFGDLARNADYGDFTPEKALEAAFNARDLMTRGPQMTPRPGAGGGGSNLRYDNQGNRLP